MSHAAPYLLAMETATQRCSIALFQEDKIVAGMTHHIAKSHSRVLPLMIRHLLSVCGLDIRQLAAVGIGTGPGSYTGLRIGAAVAKGICYSRSIPLLGVGSLEVLCASCEVSPKPAMYWGLLDARNRRSYGLLLDGDRRVVLPAQVFPMEKALFASWLDKGSILFLGSGAENHEELFADHPQARLLHGAYPEASNMGRLLYAKFLHSEWLELDSFAPAYLSAQW